MTPWLLQTDSEMARRIGDYPWSETALGPAEAWSSPLRTAVNLCLGSRMCGCIYWGAEHLIIYNDAYGSILGTKHPWALGRPASEVWPEIYDVIGPLMQRTFDHAETTGGDDVAIFLNRSGYVEEFYCSFSYTPLVDQNGGVEGVFATLPETSERVIGERRLRTLQQLGVDTRDIRHPADTLITAAAVLGENSWDIPFASLYSWEGTSRTARLNARVNIDEDVPLCPTQIELDSTDDELAAAIRAALRDGHAVIPLTPKYEPIPLGGWQVPAVELMVLAFIPYGDEVPNAVMLAGVSPLKRLDDEHLTFFYMLADQLRRSLAEAYSHEKEDLRARELRRDALAEQQAERVNIARDLHDTVLQSMQGMCFLLEAGLKQARAGDAAALELFENALRASEYAVEEGREVLSLLRRTAPVSASASESVTQLGKEILPNSAVEFDVFTKGEPRPLRAEIWNETYSICREAMTNAARHAGASTVHIVFHYGECFSVSVHDDGAGVPVEFLLHGRVGHFGLPGMRERASNIGGRLTIAAANPHGTVVTVEVPGVDAYQAP